MTQLGYTLESADAGDLRWVPIQQVTFLKREFRPDPISPCLVRAPRPIQDVYTQLMWRRSEPTLESQECCFYAFAMELGQHTKTVQEGGIFKSTHRNSFEWKRSYEKCYIPCSFP